MFYSDIRDGNLNDALLESEPNHYAAVRRDLVPQPRTSCQP